MRKILLSAALASTIVSASVWAASDINPQKGSVTENSKAQQKETLQVATQGMNAMYDIKMARRSIFEGHPDAALKFTNEASVLLSDANIDWGKFVKDSQNAKMVAGKYVVINATISLSEDYVASPEKAKVIKLANQKLAAGDKKGALETLKEAGVSVMQSQYLMPLESTRDSVKKAQKMLKEGKYYEANLVLKGAEEAIVVTSEGLVEEY